jgi:hypothetical protein
MNIRKAITGLAASVALTAAMVAPSFAQAQQNFASATSVTTPTSNGSTAFTYTGTQFTVSSGAQFQGSYTYGSLINAFPATLTLAGLANVPGTFTSTVSGGNTTYTQGLTGSGPAGFTLTYAGTGNIVVSPTLTIHPGDTLLSGTYDGSTLAATIPGGGSSTTASVRETLNGLNYTSSVFFNLAQANGLTNPGAFSFDLTSVATTSGASTPSGTAPYITVNAGGTAFNPFTAGGSGTFSASQRVNTGVPEPGTYAAFLVGGLGVLGLMVGARKRGMVA